MHFLCLFVYFFSSLWFSLLSVTCAVRIAVKSLVLFNKIPRVSLGNFYRDRYVCRSALWINMALNYFKLFFFFLFLTAEFDAKFVKMTVWV